MKFILLAFFILVSACLSTNIEGYFAVTQKLVAGKYEMRVLSSKYKGTLSILLTDKPVRDLIFEVTPAK